MYLSILFYVLIMPKTFDCVDHNKLWEVFKRWEYQTTWPASWETYMQVKKKQLELDMEQQTSSRSGKVYVKAVTLLFNFNAEYLMRNAGLDEAQAGIKIARRNINNLRYSDLKRN